MAYRFREEEKPKFNITGSFSISLLLLLLLFLGLKESQLLQADPAELARLQEMAEQQKRDLVFRFSDSPEEEVENEEARFASDVNRKLRAQDIETPEESQDPAAIGNSYEPQAGDPAPPTLDQVNQQASLPSPAQVESPESASQADEPEEPEPEAETAPEPVEAEETAEKEDGDGLLSETSERGQVPVDPGAPKPYRKLSRSELKSIRQRASTEMVLQEQKTASNSARQYHNPGGRRAPDMGVAIDTAGHNLGPYLKILKDRVESNWRVPSIARFEVSGVSVVYFKLHQDGSITDIRIIQSSEHEPLDTSSSNAIKAVTGMPPLPDHIDEPWIPIKFGFYYNMRPPF